MSRKQVLTLASNLQTLASQLLSHGESLPEDEPTERGETAEFVTETLFRKRTGYRTTQLEYLRQQPDIIDGVHYRKPPVGERTWNEEAVMQWQGKNYQSQDLQVSKSVRETEFSSQSCFTGNGSESVSGFQQRLKGFKRRQGSERKSTGSVVEA